MNTTTITKALQAARECIHADRTSFADCSIGPGNTMEPDDAEALAEYDAVLALVDEALAALQPQPAAAVSDERQLLREIVENHAESLQALGDELRQRGVTQISYYGPQAEVVAKATQLIDRARAILALRPQAVPMTDEQIRSMCKQEWVFETVKQWVSVIEAHHGITAQGAQGEQA